MICEHVDNCALIQHMSKIVPFTINAMRAKYCEFNKDRCARYKLLQVFEMESIPDDLWPSDDKRGMELLEAKLNEKRTKLYGCNNDEVSG